MAAPNFWYKRITYKVTVPSTAGGTTFAAMINTAVAGSISTTAGQAVCHKIVVQAGLKNASQIAYDGYGGTPTVSIDGSADTGTVLAANQIGPKEEWQDLNDLKAISTNGTDTAQITLYKQRS